MSFFNKKNKENKNRDNDTSYKYFYECDDSDDCENNDDCKCNDCGHDYKPKPPCCVTVPTGPAGDILTVRNHSSASAVTLQTLAGGTQINSNASILIQRLS